MPPKVEIPITADNAQAQRQINETIAALDAMGRSMNAQSLTAQRAFRSEAESARQLLVQLQANERQARKLDAAIAAGDARINAMATRTGVATRTMAMGFESVARSGNLAGEGLKQIIASGAEIGFMFGPTGAVVGALGIATMGIVSMFRRAREEMEETKRKAEEVFRQMVNAGDLAALTKRAQEIQFGTVSERMDSPDGVAGLEAMRRRERELVESIENPRNSAAAIGLARRKAELEELRKEIKPLQEEYDRVRAFLLNPLTDNPPFQRPAIVSSAAGPGAGAKDAAREAQRIADRVRDQEEKLRKIGPGSVPIVEIGARADTSVVQANVAQPVVDAAQSAAAAIDPVRAAVRGIEAALIDMGDRAAEQFGRFHSVGETAMASLNHAAQMGTEALITGHEKVSKVLKRAAAEPIVAHLKMLGIDQGKKAVAAAADLNFPKAAQHLAAAAGAILGARKVAQLGGIGGGGGEGGGGSAGGSSGGGAGSQLGASSTLGAGRNEPLKMEIVFVQKTQDGKETARQRQFIQRANDRNQPIRVAL